MHWLLLVPTAGAVAPTHWRDHDLDGYGDPNWPVLPTHPRAVTNDQDCDDDAPGVHPAATEICDRLDNNCDGLVDDDDPWRDASSGRTFYLDADLDGSGDPTVVLAACALPPGFSPYGNDCDDSDRASHPLARELCDGADNDCDGLVDDADDDVYNPVYAPSWEDLDGDGFGDLFGASLATCASAPPGWVANYDDCDDGDTAVPFDDDGDGFGECAGDCDDGNGVLGPSTFEDCDGVDQDCDGHPDLTGYTGDAALLGCDLCPSADDYDEQLVQITTYNPCLLDPTSAFHCASTDGHDRGYRLHRVAVRTDLASQREPLVVYLPSSRGLEDTTWMRWAAWAGLDAISLGWSNDEVTACNRNASCIAATRREMLDGFDASSEIAISPADSIEGRLATLLAHLDTIEPTRGWSDHLVGGQVDWSTILLIGWGQGADQAAYVAQQRALHGAVMLSGPSVAGWELGPWATAPCRMWGVYHIDEGLVSRDAYDTQLAYLGVSGPPEVVDDWQHYPWSSHVLALASPPPSQDCLPVEAVAQDVCMVPERTMQAALDLLCLATEVEPGCF